MKFNFTCWALCKIEEEEGYDPVASILGFWKSRDECEEGQRQLDALASLKFYRDKEAYAKRFPFWSQFHQNDEYTPMNCVMVPLSQMEFASLDEAERMIESAAVLMVKGCGVGA